MGIYPCEESIHSNEENEENDDNFPTEIKVTITNKLLENTEAKTEEEENTLQKETDILAEPSKDKKILMSEVREENKVLQYLKNVKEQHPKDKEFLDVLEFLGLECICPYQDQHQDQPDPSEEDAEEDDEESLPMEDLLPTDSNHGGGEDENLLSEGVANPEGGKESEDDEVPPGMERTRCNKSAEDEYLEEITQRREQVAWPNKKRNYGGKSMKTDQYKGQEANNVQEYLMGEWQKTKNQIMEGKAKVFGENDELSVNSTMASLSTDPEQLNNKCVLFEKLKQGKEARATNESHKFPREEPTADKNKSSKEQTMKYRLIITDVDQEEFKIIVIEYNEDIIHGHEVIHCRRYMKRNLNWPRNWMPEA